MITFSLLLSLLACTDTPAEAESCAAPVAAALATCVDEASAALAACVASDQAPCSAADLDALDTLDESVAESCTDGELSGLSVEAAAERLRAACATEAESLSWRSFGGPQAAVWASADADTRTCLGAAHEAGAGLIRDTLAAAAGDPAGLAQARGALEASAAAVVTSACPDLAEHVAVGPDLFAERAAGQADCLLAAAFGEEDLGLSCGPSHSELDLPRGEWTRVAVHPQVWPGTVCGDGSDYSFWIRPAPEGSPLEQVFIGLQGGGVCVFEDDCAYKWEKYPDLFTAADDEPYTVAMVSDDPEVSPFANWTQVYLPYCNQDVFAGGGEVETLGELELPRAGGVNLRAALRVTRDWLWQELDAEGGEGYRGDRLQVFFGGWSAGAYGTLYNYHWLLDDLLWPRTSAFPDAGLALDNGEVLGVRALGLVKIPLWGTLPNLPPYCFSGDCAVGPFMLEALSPRLKTVPEQQVLLLSNPRDQVQQGDAYFSDEPSFINAMRRDHCATRDLPGVHWYLTSVSEESVHVVSIQDELWWGEVAGQTMRDWFTQAVDSPDELTDRAEEADFVEVIAGVEPFPCEVAP